MRTRRPTPRLSWSRRLRSVPPAGSPGGHVPGIAIWLTGLPCSGKSTIALRLAERLGERGTASEVFDGDRVRQALSADLGFSPADRVEQARRVAEAARRCTEAGTVAIVAVVTPSHAARQVAAEILGDWYLEVHVDAPLAVCEDRDVKGMYRAARAGQLPEFTGVSAPYERPSTPHLRLNTARQDADGSVTAVLDLLRERAVVR